MEKKLYRDYGIRHGHRICVQIKFNGKTYSSEVVAIQPEMFKPVYNSLKNTVISYVLEDVKNELNGK